MNAIKLSSEDGAHFVYACGTCKLTMYSEEIAESHCRCARCGSLEKRRYGIYCDTCQDIVYLERRAAEVEDFMLRDVLTEWAGPVYDEHSGEFYSDTQHLIETLRDDGVEDDDIRAHRVIPCDAVRAATPSLSEYVDEHWSEGAEESLMDGEAERILHAVESALVELAPERWEPRKERLDMAVVFDAY